MSKLKIKDKNGRLYQSCPHIDHIIEIIQKYDNIILPEELFDIIQNLEKVRQINRLLRESYNFSAVIKNIKALSPEHKSKIDEIVKLYL